MVFSCIIKGIKADLEQQCYNEACGQRLHLCLAWKCQTVFDLQNKLSSFLFFFFFNTFLPSCILCLQGTCINKLGGPFWSLVPSNRFARWLLATSLLKRISVPRGSPAPTAPSRAFQCDRSTGSCQAPAPFSPRMRYFFSLDKQKKEPVPPVFTIMVCGSLGWKRGQRDIPRRHRNGNIHVVSLGARSPFRNFTNTSVKYHSLRCPVSRADEWSLKLRPIPLITAVL